MFGSPQSRFELAQTGGQEIETIRALKEKGGEHASHVDELVGWRSLGISAYRAMTTAWGRVCRKGCPHRSVTYRYR
jgi:hypothetical protein